MDSLSLKVKLYWLPEAQKKAIPEGIQKMFPGTQQGVVVGLSYSMSIVCWKMRSPFHRYKYRGKVLYVRHWLV